MFTTIGEGAFEWTAIADLTLPSTLTTIGWEAFSLCNNLTEVIIPNSVTELGEAAFSDCENLADVTLSESLTALMTNPFDIDDNTFYHYDTAKLYVPEGTEDLYKAHNGWCLFYGIATDIRTLTDKTAVNTAVYDLGGRLINGNQSHRGVSIVKMSNGAVRKMLQK